MIGEFSFVYLSNKVRIMSEESSIECQRGDVRPQKSTKAQNEIPFCDVIFVPCCG